MSKKIGVWNTDNAEGTVVSSDISIVGYVVQETVMTFSDWDGGREVNVKIPRGANFLRGGLVRLDEKYSELEIEGPETHMGGLYQPDESDIIIPAGERLVWFVDSVYRVIGYCVVKDGDADMFYPDKESAYAYLSTLPSEEIGSSKPPVVINPCDCEINWGIPVVNDGYITVSISGNNGLPVQFFYKGAWHSGSGSSFSVPKSVGSHFFSARIEGCSDESKWLIAGRVEIKNENVPVPVPTFIPIPAPEVTAILSKCVDMAKNPHDHADGTHHGYSSLSRSGEKLATGVFKSQCSDPSVRLAIPEYGTAKAVNLGMANDGSIVFGYKLPVPEGKDALVEIIPYEGYTGTPILDGNGGAGRKVDFWPEPTWKLSNNEIDHFINISGFRTEGSKHILPNGVFISTNISGHRGAVNDIYLFGFDAKGEDFKFTVVSKGVVTRFGSAYDSQYKVNKISGFPTVEKDFLLIVERGSDYGIYVCNGWSTGGHFSTVYTLNHIKGDISIISTHLGYNECISTLTVDGGEVRGVEGFGQCFVIPGVKGEKVAHFGFDNFKEFLTVKLLGL